MLKIAGQILRTSPCSDDNDDSWQLHNPSSTKWGRQLEGPGRGFFVAGLPQEGGVLCANSWQLLWSRPWAPQFWIIRPQINYFCLYTCVIPQGYSQGNRGRAMGLLATNHQQRNKNILSYPPCPVQAPNLVLFS